MATRYNFTSELEARKAVNDCHNLGLWATTLKSGCPEGAKLIVECSELAEGLIESRYRDYII